MIKMLIDKINIIMPSPITIRDPNWESLKAFSSFKFVLLNLVLFVETGDELGDNFFDHIL